MTTEGSTGDNILRLWSRTSGKSIIFKTSSRSSCIETFFFFFPLRKITEPLSPYQKLICNVSFQERSCLVFLG